MLSRYQLIIWFNQFISNIIDAPYESKKDESICWGFILGLKGRGGQSMPPCPQNLVKNQAPKNTVMDMCLLAHYKKILTQDVHLGLKKYRKST